MRLIVGLGNPGKEYEQTRHNIGFKVLERIAEKMEANFKTDKKLETEICKGDHNGNSALLMKPTTFMNLSGNAVRKVADYYKVFPNHIFVIYDDMNFEVGILRIRGTGSSGGQNGIKDIINKMGTERIKRIKFGVGKPKGDVSKFVLNKFASQDKALLEEKIEKAANAALDFIDGVDFQKIMTKYNG